MTFHIIKQAIDELGKAFQEFKDTNEERLDNLEKNSRDVLVTDKLSRLDTFLNSAQERLQNMHKMAKRPLFGAPEEETPSENPEHKKAFNAFLRSGNDEILRRMERKTMNGKQGEDGGYFLPTVLSNTIYSTLNKVSVMREAASVVSVSRYKYEIIANTGEGGNVLWSDEERPGEETKHPKLTKITIPVFRMYERIRVSQNLLDDSAIDIERWLADKAARSMAIEENRAFIVGNGKTQPRGFLDYPLDDKGDWGKLETLKTGKKGEFAAEKPEDALLNLFHSLKPEYLADAVWMMPRSALSEVRKLKNGNGNYMWQPPLSSDMKSASLLGYPVMIADDMPELKKGQESVSIAFGNFKEGYLIVDRSEILMIRDHLSFKPLVEFFLHRCVGGDVVNSRAIKLLQFA